MVFNCGFHMSSFIFSYFSKMRIIISLWRFLRSMPKYYATRNNIYRKCLKMLQKIRESLEEPKLYFWQSSVIFQTIHSIFACKKNETEIRNNEMQTIFLQFLSDFRRKRTTIFVLQHYRENIQFNFLSNLREKWILFQFIHVRYPNLYNIFTGKSFFFVS